MLGLLQVRMGEDAGFTRTFSNELTILNFRDDSTGVPFIDDDVFLDNVQAFVTENLAALGIIENRTIWAEGEYGYVHDWQKDTEGRAITDGRSLSRRPDLHPWLLRRREVFEKIISRYSGEQLAQREQEAQELQKLAPPKKDSGNSSPPTHTSVGKTLSPFVSFGPFRPRNRSVKKA